MYRPDIDGLRAVAVLSVVIFHAFPTFLPGGFVGVDVFFVISGYLISGIVIAELDHEQFRLTRFYARRARRILPALLLILATTWGVGWLLLPPSEYSSLGKNMAAGAAFVANFASWGEIGYWGQKGYFDTASQLKPLLHLWSLGVEEQFYLFWPLLLAVAWKRHRIPSLLVFAMGLSFALNLWGTFHKPVVNFYFPLSRFWELLVGGALASMESASGRRLFGGSAPFAGVRPMAREVSAVVGLLLIVGSTFILDRDRAIPGAWAILPTIGAALLIAAGAQTGTSRRFLANPLMIRIGLISYPLYLWHWPLLAFASILALRGGTPVSWKLTAVALAFGLATETYVLIEQKAARIFMHAPYKLVGGLLGGLAAMAIVGITTFAAHGYPSRSPASVALNALVAAPHDLGMRRGTCFLFPEDGVDEPSVFDRNHCAGSNQGIRPLIMVVGDSHAAHLYTGLQTTFGGMATIGQLTTGGCIPLIVHLDSSRSRDATPRCRRINEYVLGQIKMLKPAVLVVGAYFVRYDRVVGLAYPGFLDELSRTLDGLAAAGIQNIIVVGEVPTWSPPLPQIVDYALLAGNELPRYSRRGLDASAFELENKLRRRVWGPRVHYVSLIERLCDDRGCMTTVGPHFPDDLITFDYGHFSESGSAYVADHILAPPIKAMPELSLTNRRGTNTRVDQ